MDVYVSERFSRFIQEQVATGSYATEEAVVEAALEHFEDFLLDEMLLPLVTEAEEAIEQGRYRTWSPELLNELIQRADEMLHSGQLIVQDAKS